MASSFDFTTRALASSSSRYIEVYGENGLVSRHSSEFEAIQSVSDQPDGTYELRFPGVVVKKAFGVLNPQTGDTEPPSQVVNVLATTQNSHEIVLTWDAATDNIGVSSYQVYRDGTPSGGTASTFYTDTGLLPSTNYSYEVAASDAAGNQGPRSEAVIGSTAANSNPVWSITDQAGVVSEAFSLDLDTVCTDADGDLISYSLFSGALPSGIALSGTRNQLMSGTPDTVEVQTPALGAYDGFGIQQNFGITFTVTSLSTISAPTGLAVTGYSASAVTLDWNDNTEPDLLSYSVYRSDDDIVYALREANVSQSSYTDFGLESSRTYFYKISATNTALEESALSAGVSQQTDAPYAVAATVAQLDSAGNPAGVGPADDPAGIFFGRENMQASDFWGIDVSTVPAGVTVTPLVGGSYTIAVSAGVAPGSYSFTWRIDAGTAPIQGIKGFSVL